MTWAVSLRGIFESRPSSLQNPKALLPNSTTDSGILMSLSCLQYEKQYAPISVKVEGRFMERMLRQPLKV